MGEAGDPTPRPNPANGISVSGETPTSNPSTLLSSLAYRVCNIYGVLELAGYTIAYTTPLVGGTRAKIALALLAITMITLGALVETKVILGTG